MNTLPNPQMRTLYEENIRIWLKRIWLDPPILMDPSCRGLAGAVDSRRAGRSGLLGGSRVLVSLTDLPDRQVG